MADLPNVGRDGAHPRAGGADPLRMDLAQDAAGSSPRGRGGQALIAQALYGGGLIPARAGRTSSRGRVPGPTRAHPRAGGADAITPGGASGREGSSPRGRGGRHDPRIVLGAGGLIPARAGRTAVEQPAARARRAHPRAGGADKAKPRPGAGRAGSSPRGRGGLSPPHPHRVEVGLIPARAGRTLLLPAASRRQGAHPRAGGADPLRFWPQFSIVGSSPRGRGGHQDAQGGFDADGLIPARAGRTLAAGHVDIEGGSSPRGRGGRPRG